jgi:hypothetical protein
MIAGQIGITRKDQLTLGGIHFSFKSLRNDTGGIQAKLRDSVYTRDAIIPVSPWMKALPIHSPKVTITRTADHVRASWPADNSAFWYIVYAKDQSGWSYSIVPASERTMSLSADRKIETVVVKSVDRLGNESR